MDRYPTKVQLLDEECKPYKKYTTDAGWDLRSANETFTLYKGAKVAVNTGIKLGIPKGQCGIILPRSGMGTKFRVALANTAGVIDSEYRGEVVVFLVNDGTEDVEIEQYSRIAQLLIIPVNISQLRYTTNLPPTKRGDGGFGPTGET